MTLKERYRREAELYKQDAEFIKTATNYDQTRLYHGSAADSSERSAVRMQFVNIAEQRFINEHVKDILELAAQICIEEIGE